MSIMATPWKHPKSGVFYFRRQVPVEIRSIIGRSEWKVSLRTKDLASARLRFAAELVRCEEAFLAAREQLKGERQVSPSDAGKLAARWARSIVQGWDEQPSAVKDYLLISEEEVGRITDLVDVGEYTQRESAVYGFIQESLTIHGLPLPDKADPAYRALVESFFQQLYELTALAESRYRGDWNSKVSLSSASEPLSYERHIATTSTRQLTVSQVYEAWAKDKRLTDGDTRSTKKTISDFGSTVTRFVELFGDLPVQEISRAKCAEFRELLGKIPVRGRGTRGLSAPQLIEKAEAENLPVVALGTVRKQLRAMSAILNFAVQRLGVMKEEPIAASGMLRSIAKAAKRSQTRSAEDKHYTRSELRAIFSSPLFHGEWKPAKADFGKALYWLPLLMLYTGARREELAQLDVADVIQDDDSGIWYLSIRPGDDKSIKTGTSRRRVPLHGDLLALGFPTYVESLPSTGRLFPELQPHPVNGYGHGVGKAWAKYLKEVVNLDTQASPSHGFRHTFKTLCREAGIETAVHDWITGHAAVNVGASYGSNPLQRMSEELQRFPRIALEAGLLAGTDDEGAVEEPLEV